jgi:hypothetical protein
LSVSFAPGAAAYRAEISDATLAKPLSLAGPPDAAAVALIGLLNELPRKREAQASVSCRGYDPIAAFSRNILELTVVRRGDPPGQFELVGADADGAATAGCGLIDAAEIDAIWDNAKAVFIRSGARALAPER